MNFNTFQKTTSRRDQRAPLEEKHIEERRTRFLLAVGGGGVAVVHTAWVAASGDDSLLPLTLIFWLSAVLLIWQRRQKLILEKNPLSMLIGTGLLAAFLLGGVQMSGDSVNPLIETRYLAAAPFVALLGLTLLASGWQRLRQYRHELLLMFCFGVPKALLWTALDLRTTTAGFSTSALEALGFEAVQEGTFIHLPAASVEVVRECSGLNGIFYLIAISALMLVMLPLNGKKRYFMPVLGVVIAFLCNAARVAFLAVAAADPDKFHFWHGTSIFSLGSLGLFCALYCLIYWQAERYKTSKKSA